MNEADGLLPEEYQAVIAPAMQAAAELAADGSVGHSTLQSDDIRYGFDPIRNRG